MLFQITSSILEACVLAVLSREETYGYKLTQEIMQVTNISESTLYPVLRRLQKNGMLAVRDEPYMGRNRRYYSLTEEGVKQFALCKEEWINYKNTIDSILEGDESDDTI